MTKKFDVMIGIIIYLLKNKRKKAKEIANRFEISTRTVYRYLTTLESSGIPIIFYSGRYGGVEILNTFTLSKLYFNEEEKLYLEKTINSIENTSIRNTLIDKLFIN